MTMAPLSDDAAGFVIVVDLVVDDAALPRFMPLMQANAAASLAEEPGCRRFDICVDQSNKAQILLYEIYDDAAAFDLHLASPHFLSFDAETRDMVRSKTVRRLDLRAG